MCGMRGDEQFVPVCGDVVSRALYWIGIMRTAHVGVSTLGQAARLRSARAYSLSCL
jgi:hypothetical protein